jgi:DNA polymerase III epsilon subunit-like protein
MLHAILDQADIIIGHNSDRFDIRKFNARAIKHGFTPIGKKVTIDTLKLARRTFDFTSNTLGYLATYLGVGHKENRPDWDAILNGDSEAIAYMRMYNKQDVVVTEQVYKKLMGWHEGHPDLNKIYPVRDTAGHAVLLCPTCQSPNTIKDGCSYTLKGKKQRHQCTSCGRKFKGAAL